MSFEDCFSISIAGLVVKIQIHETQLVEALIKHYDHFLSDASSPEIINIDIRIDAAQERSQNSEQYTVSLTNDDANLLLRNGIGNINLARRIGHLSLSPGYTYDEIDYYLRVLFSLLVFQVGGLLFHGAGILHKGWGYVFFGHSGAGKSTVAELSREDIVLSDDLVAILPRDRKWILYPTPFSQFDGPIHHCDEATIKCMYLLKQDSFVYKEEMSKGEIFAEVIANVPIISSNLYSSSKCLDIIGNLVDSIQIYRLHFRKEDGFWKLIDNNP